jgi:hypothetical protein
MVMGMLISAFWQYVSRFPPRRCWLRITGMLAIIFASIGVWFRWDHLSLDARMRDLSQVRKDCQELIANRPEESKKGNQWVVEKAQFPSSMSQLGASRIVVFEDMVRICFFYAGGLTDGEWGVVYDPLRHWPESLGETDALLYRDFYEYRIRGE